MGYHPSISVIVATYNRERSLVDCLASVILQDYAGAKEIIVVDQTRRHTLEVTDLFQLYRHRITRIEQPEPNLPKARNAGIAAAHGDVLLFVDDDIVLPSHSISCLARHFLVRQGKGVAGVVVSHADPAASLRAYARQLGVASVDELQGARKVERFIGALMMVSAEAVRAVGGFDERLGRLTPTAYGEDNDFCCRLRQARVPLWIDPAVRVQHLDQLAGGCASRRTDPELARKYHMKSMAYIRMKNHGRMGAEGWLQLARGFIVNREILRNRPGQILQNLATAWWAEKEVRAFMDEERTQDGVGEPTLRVGGLRWAKSTTRGKG